MATIEEIKQELGEAKKEYEEIKKKLERFEERWKESEDKLNNEEWKNEDQKKGWEERKNVLKEEIKELKIDKNDWKKQVMKLQDVLMNFEKEKGNNKLCKRTYFPYLISFIYLFGILFTTLTNLCFFFILFFICKAWNRR